VGIDLAGSDKNDTGFCLLVSDGKEKKVKTTLLKSDEDIRLQCEIIKPELIAIDAPLSFARNAYSRMADEELKEYGTLPQSLRGMRALVERGVLIGNMLKNHYKVIEVYNNASAKILGFHEKKDIEMQKRLAKLVDGELKDRIMKRDELDSITSALTAFLYVEGKTKEVGDDEGKIVIPKI
jgi:predicted nuclease with RNAse H fold